MWPLLRNVEFNDELSMAMLLGGQGDRSSHNGYHHHHHPTTVYRTHNIFDVSASRASSTASSAFPTHCFSSSTTNNGGGAGSQPNSLHETYQQKPFNSTLPAIYSIMRYDPPSSPQLPPSSTTNQSPSSFHPAYAHIIQRTPSSASPSRSRSRPPP